MESEVIHLKIFTNKRSASLCKKRILLVGVQGFEPRKCLSQSQVPYRLATPQYSAAARYDEYERQLSLMVGIDGFEPSK